MFRISSISLTKYLDKYQSRLWRLSLWGPCPSFSRSQGNLGSSGRPDQWRINMVLSLFVSSFLEL